MSTSSSNVAPPPVAGPNSNSNSNNNNQDHVVLNVTATATTNRNNDSNDNDTPISPRMTFSASYSDDGNDENVGNDNSNNNPSTQHQEQQQQRQKRRQQQQQMAEEDDDLLQRAVRDAGRWAYGTVVVEVWVLNETKTKLKCPRGGSWVDAGFQAFLMEQQQQQLQNNSNVANAAAALWDTDSPLYVPPVPVSPGVGLAGAMWSEVQPPPSSAQSATSAILPQQQQQQLQQRVVAWRNLQGLSNDPDQPYDKRIKLLVQCGLGYVAAVSFDNNHQQGMVLYMTRPTANRLKVQSSSNEAYLRSAADLIGSAYALRGPRRAAVAERQAQLLDALRRARTKLLALKHMGMDLSTLVDEPKDQKVMLVQEADDEQPPSACQEMTTRVVQHVTSKTTTLVDKCKGANVPAPPAFTREQSLYTFCGALITMLMITRTNVHLLEEHGKEYGIVLGPFGALMTLLYGLTAAPASQPRNIILGQAISLTVGLCFAYWTTLPMYVRQGMATAVAVGIMVKFGIIHPPAGASAFMFSSGLYGWGNMLVMIAGNVMAIATATIINNMSDKRQYPTSWGFQPLLDLWPAIKVKSNNDGDEGEVGEGDAVKK